MIKSNKNGCIRVLNQTRQKAICHRRNLGTNPPPPKKPPDIKIDTNLQSNSVLHQKAARAAELHAELNALLDAQAKRRADEANRPIGAGFLDFVKKSKSELINIFAAFTCVLLSWQIVSIRKGARKLIDSAEEQNQKMEEMKIVLRKLSSDDFQSEIANKFELEAKRNDIPIYHKGSKSRWLGTLGVKPVNNQASSKQVLKTILKAELGNVIGDKALTTLELEDKRLADLQKEMGITMEEKSKKRTNTVKPVDNSLGELQSIFAEVQREEGSERTVVKRSKGFI
jgi:hypothetical protein